MNYSNHLASRGIDLPDRRSTALRAREALISALERRVRFFPIPTLEFGVRLVCALLFEEE